MDFVREFKVNVHADPIDGYSMKDYNFECHFYVKSAKSIVIKKADMKMVDADNYIAIFDSDKVKALGKGALFMTFVAFVPDKDFPDGFRTEVAKGDETITIL